MRQMIITFVLILLVIVVTITSMNIYTRSMYKFWYEDYVIETIEEYLENENEQNKNFDQ